MAKMNLEKLAAERRMKQRGAEHVRDSGFTRALRGQMNANVDKAERFIQEAKRWGPIEDVVERTIQSVWLDRFHPNDARETRAQRMAHTRAILEACED